MAGSINDFKSSFKGDLARPNRFIVDVPIPATLLPYVRTSRNLRYRCDGAQLPGRSLATTEQKTYGPIEKHPYLSTYNDIDLTFLIDDDMDIKVFFDAWLNFINPSYSNNFRYKSEYSTDLTVTQYDVSGEASYSVNLYEAFPISINQLDLDWSNDGYHKLTVTFAYTYWKNNSLQALGMEILDAQIGNVVERLGGLGGTASGAVQSITGSAIGAVGTGIDTLAKSLDMKI